MTAVAKIIHEVEKLTEDEREEFFEILRQKDLEKRRAEIAREIEEADREFAEGKTRRMTPAEIMSEALSDET